MELMMQIILIVFFPFLAIKWMAHRKIGQLISPVVLCYGLGMLLAYGKWIDIDEDLAHHFSIATVLLAIPLMLFTSDLNAWRKQARPIVLSFLLCLLSGAIVAFGSCLYWRTEFPNSWQISSMLLGVYSGGTPNMQAIGLALNVDKDLFILLNAADLFCSGIYLILLTSFWPSFIASFFPVSAFENNTNTVAPLEEQSVSSSFSDLSFAVALAILIVTISVGLVYLITGSTDRAGLIFLLLTSLSILASFSAKVRAWKMAYRAGEYLLLMFCLAIGMLADLEQLWSEGGRIIIYTASVLLSLVIMHYLLALFFRLDRDSVLITSTAAVFGPAFIGQIASVLKNPNLVLPGMITALVGMAVGNYLGIGMAWGLELWLGH